MIQPLIKKVTRVVHRDQRDLVVTLSPRESAEMDAYFEMKEHGRQIEPYRITLAQLFVVLAEREAAATAFAVKRRRRR